MSHVPQASRAHIQDPKVRDYLLNAANPQNRGKARQFSQYGFSRDQWQGLAAALARHIVANQVADASVSPHGVKYVVECTLQTPDGRNPCLRSVWIIETGQDRPRLVTAY